MRRAWLEEEGDKDGMNEITKHPCCPFILTHNGVSEGGDDVAKAITNI